MLTNVIGTLFSTLRAEPFPRGASAKMSLSSVRSETALLSHSFTSRTRSTRSILPGRVTKVWRTPAASCRTLKACASRSWRWIYRRRPIGFSATGLDNASKTARPANRLLKKPEGAGHSDYKTRWMFRSKTGEVTEVPVNGSIVISSATALREAMLAGLGAALLPTWLVRGEIKTG